MKWFVIITGIVVIGAVCYLLFGSSSIKNVDNPAKLERHFTTEEESTIAAHHFTLSELKQYDGKNGHKAYIAINDVVYDVSAINRWTGGIHHGVSAGTDVTAQFIHSGHGVNVLNLLPVVGGLTE